MEEVGSDAGDRVIIMSIESDPRGSREIAYWHALWEGPSSPVAPLGEFDGSREAALAWARNTGAQQILIFDPLLGDLVRVS